MGRPPNDPREFEFIRKNGKNIFFVVHRHNVETKKMCQTDSRSGGIGMILPFLLPDTALETTV